MAANESINTQTIHLQDVVETKSRQLRALLYITYGNARETFSQMSDALQDEYMWACADMASDIVVALEGISDLRDAAEVQHG